MNLFYLDKDHDKNAAYHIDKHVARMVLEAAEMLCMAHWTSELVGHVPRQLNKEEYQYVKEACQSVKNLPPEGRKIPYIGRAPHLNHPSTIWVRSSLENYAWTYCYMDSLEAERRHRFKGGVPIHKAYRLCQEKLGIPNIPDEGFTPFAKAMKDFLKIRPDLANADPIEAYRAFYIYDKHTFASWTNREPPSWWSN